MNSPTLNNARPYQRRQPVAKFMKVGNITVGGIQRTLWGFMSFYTGPTSMPLFGSLQRHAPVDEFGQLRLDHLEEGDIIVDPGLVYKPIPLMNITGKMMAEHTKAMKKFRPRDILVTERDTTLPAVDMGVIKLPG